MSERYIQKTKDIYPGDILYIEVEIVSTKQQAFTPVKIRALHPRSIEVVLLAGENLCIFVFPDKENRFPLWEHHSDEHNFRPIA